MKKITTLLIAVLCSVTSFSQILSLVHNDRIIENGSTTIVEGSYDDIFGMLKADVYIKNNSDVLKKIKVKITAVKGDSEICWPTTCRKISEGSSLTLGPNTIRPNQAQDLLIECLTTSIATHTVEIVAWCEDQNENVEGLISATVTFTNDPTLGVSTETVAKSNIYMQDNALHYQFANANNRQLQIYDITGKSYKNTYLNNTSGNISVSEMPKGIYLYKVSEAGRNQETGKFLVR